MVGVRLLDDVLFFFFSSRRRHTRSYGDWSSDVCSSDLRPRNESEAIDRIAVAMPNVAMVIAAPSVCGTRCTNMIRRSEERRVGKECRSRWGREGRKKKRGMVGRNAARRSDEEG